MSITPEEIDAYAAGRSDEALEQRIAAELDRSDNPVADQLREAMRRHRPRVDWDVLFAEDVSDELPRSAESFQPGGAVGVVARPTSPRRRPFLLGTVCGTLVAAVLLLLLYANWPSKAPRPGELNIELFGSGDNTALSAKELIEKLQTEGRPADQILALLENDPKLKVIIDAFRHEMPGDPVAVLRKLRTALGLPPEPAPSSR